MKSTPMIFLVAALLSPTPAAGDPPAPARKLRLHGYLSQAWANADFVDFAGAGEGSLGTIDERGLGIPEDGTFDYRTMALQLSYRLTSRDLLMLQVSHDELGSSPFDERDTLIEIDWAYYARRFPLGEIRLGRAPIAFGLANEVRDVGTLFPFFRPSYVFYREGAFATESVDGISALLRPREESRFRFDFYIGRWDLLEVTAASPTAPATVGEVGAEGFGGSVWFEGRHARAALGYQEFDTSTKRGEPDVFRRPGEETTWSQEWVSFELDYDRWRARLEARFLDLPFNPELPPPFPSPTVSVFGRDSGYVQVGFRITEKWSLWAQYELLTSRVKSSNVFAQERVDIFEDFGLALNYRFSEHLVLKAEYHVTDASDLSGEPFTDAGAFGFRFSPVSSIDRGNYSILTVAVSF